MNKALKSLIIIFLLVLSIPIQAQDETKDSLFKVIEQKELKAISCYENSDIPSAIVELSNALEIRKRVLGTDNSGYAVTLSVLAAFNSELGNYAEAIRLGTEAMKIQKKVLGADHPDYATSLNNLASYSAFLGNYSEAIRLGAEAMKIQKKVLGADHPDYATSLNNLASYNAFLGNYSEAIRLGTEAMEIRKKVLGSDHLDYAISLSNLASYNSELGNYSEAIRLGTEAMKIRKKVLGSDHPDYVISLSSLASYNSELGNYAEAIRLGTEAMETRKRVLGPDHSIYATSLDNLALYNSQIGNYSEAIRLGTEAMETQKRVLGPDHPSYATSLNNLASYYFNLGNYVEAVRLGTEAMETRKRVLGPDHSSYATSLNNLALYNSELGNYSEAIRLGDEAMEILKRNLGPDHPSYATSLDNLASYNSDLGNYAEAIRLGAEAMEILKRILGPDHPSYATSLNNLANYNSILGNYSEAIRLGAEAMEIRKRVLGPDHPDYATSLGNLALYNSELGNYSEAIRLETEAMEIRKRVLGENHPNYAKSLSKLASYNSYLGNYSEAIRLGTEAMEIRSNNIFLLWGGLSSQRRNHNWNQINWAFLNYYPRLAYLQPTSNAISTLYDKSALLAKGILLNTEIEMKKLIEESGDAKLIECYQEILKEYQVLDKQINLPIAERCVNTDSLRMEIQKQEDILVRKSKAYGDYMRNLKLTWKDVQQSLGGNDIAIEFLDFPLSADSVQYVALTLKKGYDSPRMIPLFEIHQLKGINENVFYRTSRLANLIWNPLQEELKDVKNVYFSPSGELHRIGIEYLPLNGNEYVFDRYQMYRLSSTRQLVMNKKEITRKQAVIYGGLDYDAPISTTSGIERTDIAANSSNLGRTLVDSLSVRGGREYLEGTKVEADTIVGNLKRNSWNCTYYTDSLGTEESFKRISGNNPTLLHVATHGFYMTEEEARKEQELSLLRFQERLLEDCHAVREDKPMTRSGLFLSGCNHVLNHEPIPSGIEDGILTAQEISVLDLRGLDIVVLSACQTGLGDVISGEGVFGLQRGFKKAGANTILMSLNKVDDEATRIFMVEFYKNLMSGETKRQSLKDAQKYLRSVENGKYDKPEYWASFIMLDGLN